ncbi:MAG: hypothetical protein ABI809_13750 [Caldimonas sp.]
MSRVGIVSVHYYPGYLQRSLEAVADLARRTGAQAVIAVANRPELLPQLQAQSTSIRGFDVELHDNTGFEFGAYQAGLRRCADADLDWVVFANDTFSVHHNFSTVYRRHLVSVLKQAPNETAPQAAGQVESMPRSYAIEGKRAHRWLTTSIFALNRPALDLLGHKLHFPEVDALIRTSGNLEEFFSPRLDRAMAEHIEAWLFGTCPRLAWYGAEPLTAINAARFANKARTILQEKYIAAVLEEAGAWFFDIKASGVREKILKRVEAMLFRMRPAPRPGIEARP